MDYDKNEAQYAQALSFEPVLPYPLGTEETRAAPVWEEKADGTLCFSFPAPQAESVTISMDEHETNLKKGKDGVFYGEVKKTPGFHYLQLKVDGMDVITPMLPVGYGCMRPVNYVETGGLPDFCSIKEVGHGSVAHEYYKSSVTGRYETCLVYLPPEYGTEDRTYPVLYLQHGYGENENGWVFQGKMNFILDNLIAEGKAVPMVVVMNNGMVQAGSVKSGREVIHTVFEELLVRDVIPYIEHRYRIQSNRGSRAVAGLSMGSMQSCVLGFKHRELFAWIGLFSGFMRDFIRPGDQEHLKILQEDVETFNRETRLFFRAMGREDKFYSYFQEEDAICEAVGVKQVRRIYPGIHDWNFWRMTFYDFAQLLFKQ